MRLANEFFKTDWVFSPKELQNDLAICQQQIWKAHFNTGDYEGSWTSFALRSTSGDEFDIFPTPNAEFYDTPTLSKCTYFKHVIDSFECHKEAVRLLSLLPNSNIKEHRDAASSYEYGYFRMHVPIQTNEKVVFRVNGHLLPMKVGECWYANFDLPHYVSNEGDLPRIHLVIDCIRNQWSDDFFRNLGYDFKAEEKKKNINIESKKLMIEQLQKINTETSRNIIANLQAEIAEEGN